MIELVEKNDVQINRALNNYIRKLERNGKVRVHRKDVTYNKFFADKMLIVKSIRSGIPYTLFKLIKDITPFTENDWATFLDISTKSLQRYKKESDYVFKPIHSEKIIELAEVTNLGKDIFDSTEQFYTWLNSPSLALGNIKPIELLKDSYGKEIVINELNRIDQGIFV
ncbi:MAG: antitoxin Xre/MbcA/ParS toxin-binding domain-containing protein [Lutibacter sp.]|jgi:putative toxin-antitoxin system antitoxin component (TIGR02293 family)